jgi:hypothetical protein
LHPFHSVATTRAAFAIAACLSTFALPALADTITVFPPAVEQGDAYARTQLVVSRGAEDVTRTARYESAANNVAQVSATGLVSPVSVGETHIKVTAGNDTVTIPVVVKAFNTSRPIDFGTEIVPLLTRFGCNAGGCHGKASGQNGFKLSLFGFDTKFDYEALVEQGRGRRVFQLAPERSLLLTKATGVVPHGGGKRIDVGSEPYRMLYRWIESGAPASAPDVPTVARIEITPAERILRRGNRQQLAVNAVYSDGTRRDVTRDAEFSSNLDVVAAVDAEGLVNTGDNSGEAAIMARYMGQVAVFRAILPHGEPLKEISGFVPNNRIDELAVEKWKKLGLVPSPTCDDATFLRRVTLDVCGRLPTTDEVREFLGNAAPDKRSKAIDRLLDSPDYAAFFAMRWGSILRNSKLAGADQASYAFHNWIKDMIARNRPYDEFVRGIVAAAGEWQSAPAINWYWQSRDDQLHQVTADTAQVFLGIRLQCARCHHHPYEKWGQDDYYGLAGFFTRLGRKSFGQPPPYFSSPNPTMGEPHPRTGKPLKPKFLDGDEAEFTSEQDPRHGLVDWMARPENPFFARILVNRMWGHFFGRGLVDQVDDMRETNPPSNPELLDYLAAEFKGTASADHQPSTITNQAPTHRFDTKHLIRLMLNSRVYQLSSEPTDANKHDQQNFARYYARRLYAEVLHDSLDQACGTRTRFGGVSTNARAIDLPHEGFGSYFLDTFDRPRRVSGCECERSSGATLAQVLLVANSDEVENKIAAGDGLIARWMKEKEKRPIDAMVEELYLGAFCRMPSAAERKTSIAYVEAETPENRQKALEDLLWSLVNSREFMFNH